MKPLYTATATTTAGRNGHSETSDGKIKFDLNLPKELGGSGVGTNPEQLFACGYSACFGGAIDLVARQKKHVLKHIEVTAKVVLNQTDAGGFALSAEIHANLPELSKADAEAIVAEAHKVCPYSNATRNNIEVKVSAN